MEHKCLSPWKGAIAGGLVVFAWGAISWMVLPFHEKTIHTFGDQASVVNVLTMGKSMALGLLLQMVGAFFWTWILGKIPGLTLKDAALYGLFFGLCVGILGFMPNWAWWKFPFGFSLIYVIDAAVAWPIASVVIAKWCQESSCKLP